MADQGTSFTAPIPYQSGSANLIPYGGTAATSPHRSIVGQIFHEAGLAGRQVASSFINAPTGAVHMAEGFYHDPWGELRAIGSQYKRDFTNPGKYPGYLGMDILGLAPTPFAFIDRAAEAGRVFGGASRWADRSVTARRVEHTPEGQRVVTESQVPIDTALTRSQGRQFIQALIHGAPVPERIIREYAQTPKGTFTRRAGAVTAEQRGFYYSRNLGVRSGQQLLDKAHENFPNVRFPAATQARRLSKARQAELRGVKSASRKASLQLLKQHGRSPADWHETVSMLGRGVLPEEQLQFIDDLINSKKVSGFQLKNALAWRERTAAAAKYLEPTTVETAPTTVKDLAVPPEVHPDQLSMDIPAATGPHVTNVPMPATPMSEVQVGDKITFMGKTGTVTEMRDAGPFYHVSFEGKTGTTPIPKHAPVDVTRPITHEAPAPTQPLTPTVAGPERILHPGGTYTISKLRDDAPKGLKDYAAMAESVSKERSRALVAAGELSHEADWNRILGPRNVIQGRGLIPDLKKLEHKLRFAESAEHFEDARRLRSELNYWRQQLNVPLAEGEQTALETADLPKPVLDPALAQHLFRVPEKIDFATKMRDFMRPWRGGRVQEPGSLTHAYTGAVLRAGGPAANTARLLAESHIEAQRFLYLNAVRADLLARAHDTPVNIPAKYRLPIVTDYWQGHLPPGFTFAEQKMDEGLMHKDEVEAVGRWYEPIRQLLFERGTAVAWAENLRKHLLANPDEQSGLNYMRQRGAPFQTVKDLEDTPVRGIRWIDRRQLGGLDQQNPLWSLMDNPVARKAFRAADAVNDATKMMVLYLKPSYLIPNFVGNVALTLIHQGFLSPNNAGKTLKVMFTGRGLSKDTVFAIKSGMGEGFTGALEQERTLRGYAARGAGALANVYGKVIDDPFRFMAALHEARVAGFTTLADVEKLFQDSRFASEAQEVLSRANDALIDYERLSPAEQSILRRAVFFYPWVKGSSRYGYQLSINHPVASAVNTSAGQEGEDWIKKTLGDIPSYAEGITPIGGGREILNPASASILGTGGGLLENLINVFSRNPDPNLNLVGELAPADLFPYTLLTGKTAIPHDPHESPFMAAVHQLIQNPFVGTPSSLYEQLTGGPANPNSLYPDNNPIHAILRTGVGGGLIPRTFNKDWANWQAYQAQHPHG